MGDTALKKMAKRINDTLKSDEFLSIVADNETAGAIKTWVSTGNYALNYACSGSALHGGFPFGRVVEMFGDPSTGKSLLGYHLLAETQKMGGIAILLDTEGAYTRVFGAQIGIDNEKMLFGEPDTVEDVFRVVEEICQENDGTPTTIFWDSIAQTSTHHEMEADFGVSDMSKAKMIKAGFRRVGRRIGKSNVLFVGSNHIISNIGVLYGRKDTTPGGKGYAFASSLRLDLRKGKNIKGESGDAIGTEVVAKVDKSKIAIPYRSCTIEISWLRGVDPNSGLLDLLVSKGVVERSGAWLSYGEGRKFRSSEFVEVLSENPALLEKLSDWGTREEPVK